MLLMENGNRREVSGHLMGKKCKNCCILMGKRIFAEAAPVSRYAVMLVTASLIAACKYLHRGLLMYGRDGRLHRNNEKLWDNVQNRLNPLLGIIDIPFLGY